MITERVTAWVAANPLSPSDIDCATTVMLKILDGKCKMGELDKLVMAALYDAVKAQPGQRFGDAFHTLIDAARQQADEVQKDLIYEKRVLAETEISRPVMKAFKAMIRQQGLFDGLSVADHAAE